MLGLGVLQHESCGADTSIMPSYRRAALLLALFCAECLYGPARVRLEARHAVTEDGSTCVIETRGEAAEAAVRLCTAFAVARVGEDGFTVEHVDQPATSPSPAAGRSVA